jgi:hypothetical protein
MVAELTRAQADLLQPHMVALILCRHLLINMRTIILLGMRRLLWLS